jgi:hypothetical protein
VLLLALVHHLLVSERAPLDGIADLAAGLTRATLIAEFVPPEDPMFRRLARGREELHRGLNAAVFEASFGRRFEIVKRMPVEGTGRQLYYMRRIDCP